MRKFQNILVAFDLNKTLFYKSQSPLQREHDRKIKKKYFYLRPHVKELADFLHAHEINYCFWSNMIAKNCQIFVTQLESFGLSRHCGVFDQEFCDKPQHLSKQSQQGEKIKYMKNLNKLAQLFKINVDHCVLVDDSKQKNVQGCNLIHVSSFEGKKDDKEILYIIERIKEFRQGRVNEQSKKCYILKYIDYNQSGSFEIQQQFMSAVSLKQQTKPIQKTSQDIELENQLNAQLKKFKANLVQEKQAKKHIKQEIQTLKQTIDNMAQQVKKQSDGKCVRKGDTLLVQVLTFAKNKKASEQKILALEKEKNEIENKISLIKKLMRQIVKKLNINDDHERQQQVKVQNHQQKRSETKYKKSKKSKKECNQLQPEKQQIVEKGQKKCLQDKSQCGNAQRNVNRKKMG